MLGRWREGLLRLDAHVPGGLRQALFSVLMEATRAIGNEDRKLDYSSLQPTLQSSTDKLSSYNPASHSSTKSPTFSTEFHYKTFPVAYHS
ncbi:hypothetical protein FOVSG1_012504 [Fusarium oxysporum f. sp. vasinfectum]